MEAIEWVTAATALRYLSDETYTYNEQRVICERVRGGLIASRADMVLYGGKELGQKRLPRDFWQAAGAGHEGLIQDWSTGDFATTMDCGTEAKAFGVQFDLVGVMDLLPAEKRADGLRRISVAANPDWLHARDLIKVVFEQTQSLRAKSLIIDACRLGQLTARAVRASGFVESRSTGVDKPQQWAKVEWDVPIWFWREFVKSEVAQDFQLGTAEGQGIRGGREESLQLQGLHFHRSGLAFFGSSSSASGDTLQTSSNRGRRAKYDWPAACVAIYGKLERGELKPQVQADVEKSLISHLSIGDESPSESTVRPYAKLIWEEFRTP